MIEVVCPEQNDKVILSDGKTGRVADDGDDQYTYIGDGDWQVAVFVGEDNDEEEIPDVQIQWDSDKSCWVEIL